jgi:hypothetical protein
MEKKSAFEIWVEIQSVSPKYSIKLLTTKQIFTLLKLFNDCE